jgi:hypothetical protein
MQQNSEKTGRVLVLSLKKNLFFRIIGKFNFYVKIGTAEKGVFNFADCAFVIFADKLAYNFAYSAFQCACTYRFKLVF